MRIQILLFCIFSTLGFMFKWQPGNNQEVNQGSDENNKIVNVLYCDLVARPELYNGRKVRVEVSYFTDYESHFLYDLGCPSKENYSHSTLLCSTREICKELKSKINKNLTGIVTINRGKFIVVGRFHGPGDYAKRFPNTEGARFFIEIEEIEKAIPIPKNAPWPWEVKK